MSTYKALVSFVGTVSELRAFLDDIGDTVRRVQPSKPTDSTENYVPNQEDEELPF
jgi:hypothetical protein